jgi:hypothetical protein
MVFVKHLGIKKPPDYGQEAIQMFSQRNNPYCDLLQKCSDANVKLFSIQNSFSSFF